MGSSKRSDEPEGLMALELPPEEAERLIDSVARRIVNWGMDIPAVITLEVLKPVSFIAGNFLITVAPFLYPIFGHSGLNRFCGLLNNREYLQKLMDRIEELSTGAEETEKKSEERG